VPHKDLGDAIRLIAARLLGEAERQPPVPADKDQLQPT
jgi:hypothetical protein